MQLLKTDKARTELQIGNRTLGQRERALLILADGRNTVETVNHLFGGEALRLATHLMHSGYLVPPQEPAVRTAPAKLVNKPARVPETAPAAPPAPLLTEVVTPAVSADNFEGKKSAAPDGASASNARVAKAAGVPATYSNGPNSEVIGQINVFGGNQWGDTKLLDKYLNRTGIRKEDDLPRVEKLTGMSGEELRPDLYPRDAA